MTHTRNSGEQDLLAVLARDWNRRVYVAFALWSLAFAVLATALAGVFFDWSGFPLGVTFLVSAAVALALKTRLHAHHLATPASMARHLNRIAPGLQDSADLLLKKKSELTAVDAAQIERIAPELRAAAAELQHHRLGLRQAWTAFAASLLLGTLLLLAGGRLAAALRDRVLAARSADHPVESIGRPAEPPRLLAAQITVRPPAYTGLDSFEQTELDLEASEGSTLSWSLRFDQELTGAVLRRGGLPDLALEKESDLRYSAQTELNSSGFYAIAATAHNGLTLESEYYRLIAVKDRPAEIRFQRPSRARTVLDPSPRLAFELEAVVRDDYGIGRAALLLTLARGSGENVRFREKRVALQPPAAPLSTEWSLVHGLDLAELGMEPGDELYFRLEVWDNREPEANRSLSESLALIIRSPETPLELSSEGMAIDLVPEYFRSQRQIIIDTEKLIADRSGLSRNEFRRRAQRLGADQKILRLKYGQFLGEEFESGVILMDRTVEAELAELEGEDHEHGGAFSVAEHADDHDHDENLFETDENQDSAVLGNADLEPFVHAHDTMEDATFFSKPVKEALKRVLAHMWEAELYLRTFRPRTALPPEYRALKELKEIQQAARVYVQRVGFEPPPIHEDEMRFSGDLKELEEQRAARERRVPEERRRLLAALEALDAAREGSLTAAQGDDLEALRALIQDRAAQDPRGYLDTLNRVKNLLASVARGQEPAPADLDAIEGAIWNLLPPPASAPSRNGEVSDLAGAYFRQIGQPSASAPSDPR